MPNLSLREEKVDKQTLKVREEIDKIIKLQKELAFATVKVDKPKKKAVKQKISVKVREKTPEIKEEPEP